MSYSVEFTTKKDIEPEKVFQKIADHGEGIMVTSSDFPSLKFGVMNESLRGIEVNRSEEGYEVRCLSCSSAADYFLFSLAVDAVTALSEVEGISEDGIPIVNPYESYGEKWVDFQLDSSRNIISTMVNHTGSEIVMTGMFFPFCIGINLLREFQGSAKKPSKEAFGELLDYLVHLQWSYSDAETTRSMLRIQNPNDENDRPLGISLIAIENNQLNNFQIVTHDDLVGFVDMDRDKTVLIHFNDFRKTIHNNKFLRIDECQYRICDAPTADNVRNMMEIAQRFHPDDLFYRPTFPGSGKDPKQSTFILMWNPSISSVNEDGFVESMIDMFEGWFNWSVFEWQKAKMGDRFYLIRVGEGNKNGVVMAGIFGSQPYKSDDWSGKKRVVYYMDLYPNVVVNPKTEPIMTTEELEKVVPDYQWRGGHSGIMLNKAQAEALEATFALCLAKLEKSGNDGDDVLIRHRI